MRIGLTFYPMTDSEAMNQLRFNRAAYKTGKYVAVAGIAAEAAAGLVNYLGGPNYSDVANQIVEIGLLANAVGLISMFVGTRATVSYNWKSMRSPEDLERILSRQKKVERELSNNN